MHCIGQTKTAENCAVCVEVHTKKPTMIESIGLVFVCTYSYKRSSISTERTEDKKLHFQFPTERG